MHSVVSPWTSREERTQRRSRTLIGWQVRTCLCMSLSSICGWPATELLAAESIAGGQALGGSSEPSEIFLTDVPPEAKYLASSLQRAIEVFRSSLDAQRTVKQLRAEQDDVKARLTAVTGEIELLAQSRQRLEQQLAALERQSQERFDALRKELEAQLEAELARTRQQSVDEFQRGVARKVQAFEARQQEMIGTAVDQELQLKEHELQQLTQEIQIQTQELLDRLGRLEVGSEPAKQLERSMSQALAQRKTELETRRNQLSVERTTLLAKQRNDFITKLTQQQQQVEQGQRLTLKEASLRSAMADLLHKTELEESGKVEQARQAFEKAKQREADIVQHEASLSARAEKLEKGLMEALRRVEALEAERQASLASLEQTFRKPNPGLRVEVISWFNRMIQQAPPELASEMGLLQQRLMAQVEQERQLEAQRRLLRERELALQLSREMTSKYQEIQLKQREEREARSRKAEELLARANQLANRGKFDEALKLIAETQALNPPQLSKVEILREELVVAKDQAVRTARAAQVERLFAQAMKVFEQGRYEDAVPLFNQVIAEEAALERSPRLAGSGTP